MATSAFDSSATAREFLTYAQPSSTGAPQRHDLVLCLRVRSRHLGLPDPRDQASSRIERSAARNRAGWGSPIGLIVAMRFAPGLVARHSSAVTMRSAAAAACLCMVSLALAPNLLGLLALLGLFGLTLGTFDISMNTQGVAIERGYGRPIMAAPSRFLQRRRADRGAGWVNRRSSSSFPVCPILRCRSGAGPRQRPRHSIPALRGSRLRGRAGRQARRWRGRGGHQGAASLPAGYRVHCLLLVLRRGCRR